MGLHMVTNTSTRCMCGVCWQLGVFKLGVFKPGVFKLGVFKLGVFKLGVFKLRQCELVSQWTEVS